MIKWTKTKLALSDLNRLLTCSICKRLIQDPCTLEACDHHFCRNCVEEVVGVNSKCPECGAFAWSKDLKVNRRLADIVTLCTSIQNIVGNNEDTTAVPVRKGTCSENVIQEEASKNTENIKELVRDADVELHTVYKEDTLSLNNFNAFGRREEPVNNSYKNNVVKGEGYNLESCSSQESETEEMNSSIELFNTNDSFCSENDNFSETQLHYSNNTCLKKPDIDCHADDKDIIASSYKNNSETPKIKCTRTKHNSNSLESNIQWNSLQPKGKKRKVTESELEIEKKGSKILGSSSTLEEKLLMLKNNTENGENVSAKEDYIIEGDNVKHVSSSIKKRSRLSLSRKNMSTPPSTKTNVTTQSKARKQLINSPSSAVSKQLVNSPSSAVSKQVINSPSSAVSKQLVNSLSSVVSKRLVNSLSSVVSKQLVRSPSSVVSKQLINSPSSVVSKQLVNSPSSVVSKQLVNSPSSVVSKQLVNSPSSVVSKQLVNSPSSVVSKQLVNSPSSVVSVMDLSPAQLTKRNKRGEGLLHVAVIKGNAEDARYLLEKGADPNARDNAGWSPLHEACNHGYVCIAELLLDNGAIVDLPGGPAHETPLHDAVANGQLQVARLLVTMGASLNARNNQGLTPFDYAFTDSMKEFLKPALSSMTQYQALTTDKENILQTNLPKSETAAKVLLYTGLSTVQKEKLELCAIILGGKVVNEFSVDVTHIVTTTSNSGFCRRTMKYLCGILCGKWIVSFGWITKCLTASTWVEESPYEVKGTSHATTGIPYHARLNHLQQLPSLFDGCRVFFSGTFDPKTPCKEELTKLVKYGGGKILTREPKQEFDYSPFISSKDHIVKNTSSLSTLSTVAYHARPDSTQYRCTIYIIYDPTSQNKQPLRNVSGPSVAPVGWLLDCISNFEILDIETLLQE